MAFPQTSVTMDFVPARLGQLHETAANTALIEVKPALLVIQPGDLLEQVFDATTNTHSLRPAQAATGALVSLAGVAIYKGARQPVAPPYSGGTTLATGYQIGDMVPYCRKGRIYAKWVSADGTTAQVAYTAPHYIHSTTTPANQGAFTDKATASTTGAEVDASPSGVLLLGDQTARIGFGVCLVELNLP